MCIFRCAKEIPEGAECLSLSAEGEVTWVFSEYPSSSPHWVAKATTFWVQHAKVSKVEHVLKL